MSLEPGAPVLVKSEIYEGVAIFEGVENDGLARVRVETTGETLLLDVENVTPCPECGAQMYKGVGKRAAMALARKGILSEEDLEVFEK